MKILDATCGFKGIWFQKNHPFVTFMDNRFGTLTSPKHYKEKNQRTVKINPDIISEWKDAPFSDNYFDVIIFDPPHLIIKRGTKAVLNMHRSYGYLYKDNYKEVLEESIKKLFKILKTNGLFLFKWCESNVKIQEIFELIPYKPLFGTNIRSKQLTSTFWVMFMKDKISKKE